MKTGSQGRYLGTVVVYGNHLTGDDVGGADEIGDKLAGRRGVDFPRRADLFDDAFVHDDDPVGHAHRFGLVMRDIDAGDAKLTLDFADFPPHVNAQLGV